jgi:hypothetical protein
MRFPAEVARERNLNIWIMQFSAIREGMYFDERPILSNSDARTTYEDGGYIEDVTAPWIAARVEDVGLASERVGRSPEETQEAEKKMLAHFRPIDRYYRLQHPRNADGTENDPVLMRCGGDPKVVPGRMCITTYRYEDLAIEYRFWPKNGFPNSHRDEQLHLPPAPSEPAELLAADARVRQWIDDLQRRP